MAQHDYSIANQGFPAFRSDLNNGLAAIVSNNSGATEPTTMFAHQIWVDTAANPSILKIRNADNDAWITIGSINQTADTFTLTSAVSATTLNTSGQVVFNDAGANVDFRVEGDTDANLLFVDASADKVGIGTSSPQELLSLAKDSKYLMQIRRSSTAGTSSALIRFTNSTVAETYSAYIGSERAPVGGAQAALVFGINSADPSTDSATERMRITHDAASFLRMASGTGGIQFNGDTAAANALDDYEEGTWTPVIFGGTTAGTGTYNSEQAVYTKIGNLVTASCFIDWSAHTGTGSFNVSGLPYTAVSSATINVQAGSTYASDFNAGTNATQLIAYPQAGTSNIVFRGFVNNATRTVPDIDTAGSIGVTLTYRV